MTLMQIPLTELWLAILLAAVFVFVVSSVIHMATPWHKGDHQPLPGEAEVLAGLRSHGLPPGDYVFPYCTSMKDMGSPETLEKYKQGPVGFMTVLPSGMPAIGKSLGQWFLFSLVVGLLTAYVCTLTLSRGTQPEHVFRVAATIAFMGYSLSTACNSIWKGSAWSTSFRFLVDGLLYGLATGATFAWQWPQLL